MGDLQPKAKAGRRSGYAWIETELAKECVMSNARAREVVMMLFYLIERSMVGRGMVDIPRYGYFYYTKVGANQVVLGPDNKPLLKKNDDGTNVRYLTRRITSETMRFCATKVVRREIKAGKPQWLTKPKISVERPYEDDEKP